MTLSEMFIHDYVSGGNHHPGRRPPAAEYHREPTSWEGDLMARAVADQPGATGEDMALQTPRGIFSALIILNQCRVPAFKM